MVTYRKKQIKNMVWNFKKKFQPLPEGRPLGLEIAQELSRSDFLESDQ